MPHMLVGAELLHTVLFWWMYYRLEKLPDIGLCAWAVAVCCLCDVRDRLMKPRRKDGSAAGPFGAGQQRQWLCWKGVDERVHLAFLSEPA